jgi:hypothetical protein
MFKKRKEEWTYTKFASCLADLYCKSSINSFKDFFEGTEGSGEKGWLQTSFLNTDKGNLLQEWVYFTLFTAFQGLSAYFKNINAEEGYKIADEFIELCGKILCDAEIINSNYYNVVISRLEVYGNELNINKEKRIGQSDNPVLNLSAKFCKLCGNEKDLVANLTISKYFVSEAIAFKKLVTDLLETIKLIH